MQRIQKKSKSTFPIKQVFGLTLNLLFMVLVQPSVHATPEKARRTEDFIDSIGINTHLYYDSSVYYQRYNSLIKPKLLELGIRHIRDGGTRNLNGYLDRLKELQSLGISSLLVFDPRDSTPEAAVSLIKELGTDVVEAVQGPNEYDLSGTDNWSNKLRNYQEEFYKAVKGDRATANVPVYGPTVTSEEAYNTIGDLSDWVDSGAMNNYYSGRNPGNSGWGANNYGSLEWNLSNVKKYAGAKPVVTTETGYHNLVNSSSGHIGIPDKVAAKYTPRVFLEHFNEGISRTYYYELINVFENSDAVDRNFGLLRNDGSEKPAFMVLKNLIGLLKDSGSKSRPGTLDYALSGNTTNIHHTLLQKNDGKFYLILWQEVSSFDAVDKKKIEVSAQAVKLTFNTPVSQANTYLPNKSTNWIQQQTNPKQIELNVPDHPLVVEVALSKD